MDRGDGAAVERAREGDRDAFRLLVECHARDMFRLAFRIAGSETEAEDIVQETFLKAWKQITKFDGRASFGTWLHRICSNCALDYIRQRRRRQEPQRPPDERGGDPMEQIPSGSPSPERLALSSQTTAMLAAALDELSGVERTAFVLRHYEGMCIEDISAVLGVKPGAAKHSVFRAVQKLRRALEPVVNTAK